MLLIALLLKTDRTFFLCLVQIDQSRSDKNRTHSKKHLFTVLVFFFVTIKLLKCQLQQIILTRFFIHFFTVLSFALVQIHNFITFSMFFHSFLRSFNKELFLHFADNAHYFNKFIFSQKKGRLFFFVLCSTRITSR